MLAFHSPFALSLLHAQRECGSRTVAAGCGFDIGVASDGDRTAGASGRNEFFARAAGQIAIASGAALLAQRMQAGSADRAGRTLRSYGAGIALLTGCTLRSGRALWPSRTRRAFKTSSE